METIHRLPQNCPPPLSGLVVANKTDGCFSGNPWYMYVLSQAHQELHRDNEAYGKPNKKHTGQHNRTFVFDSSLHCL